MSSDNKPAKMPEEAKQVIHMVLLFTGGILIVLAAYMLLDPKAVEALIPVDKQTSSIIAFALLLGGVTDIAIAQILFRRKEKR